VINYFDGLNPSVSVVTTLYQQALNTTESLADGAYKQVTASFQCPNVDHLDVSPASATIAAGQTLDLAATARDTGDHILLSSGFAFAWNSANDPVATVVSTSPAGAGVGTATVTGVAAGGPVNINATENSSGKTASASITVTPGPSLVGTYNLVSMRNGGCPLGGTVACSSDTGAVNTCIVGGVMTFDGSGNWSINIQSVSTTSNGGSSCASGTPPSELIEETGTYGSGTPLSSAMESPGSDCTTLGNYLAAEGYCTEFPAGDFLFTITISGPAGAIGDVAADPTGTNLTSDFAGDTVWVRQ
jgi:hypothetical protein